MVFVFVRSSWFLSSRFRARVMMVSVCKDVSRVGVPVFVQSPWFILLKVLSNSDSFFVCLEFTVCVLKGLGQQVMVLFFVCLEFLVCVSGLEISQQSYLQWVA